MNGGDVKDGSAGGSRQDGDAPRSRARRSDHPTDLLIRDESQQIAIRSDEEIPASTRRVDLEAIKDSVLGDVGPQEGEAETTDLSGRTFHGRYRLEHLLGSGGMGNVYVGRHLNLDMPIAVKIMHPHVAAVPEFARRFRREARAASLLHHRNVVQVLDFGADGQQLYLVMELLHGDTLGEWLLDFDAPPPLADVADIMGQLLDAFEAAHRIGIVHRDLKPDNVFLTQESDGKRIVKVVDFGLARVDDPSDQGPTLTQADVVSGTPEYMSPEQCQSLSVGPSTDLYAIGCVLTDLLQLVPPFKGENAMAVLTRQMFWPAPGLDRPPGAEPVPPLLERLRLDLLAKSPDKRPSDISEVRKRFVDALSPEETARQLPARKGHEPAGPRRERVPDWTHTHTPSPRPVEASTQEPVTLVRLAHSPHGVVPHVSVGLAAHGLLLQDATAEQSPQHPVTIIDAADQHEEAIALLDRWKTANPTRVLVCADKLDTAAMNRFIAAGVADVVTYPVDVDVLLRKLKRLSRRRRR